VLLLLCSRHVGRRAGVSRARCCLRWLPVLQHVLAPKCRRHTNTHLCITALQLRLLRATTERGRLACVRSGSAAAVAGARPTGCVCSSCCAAPCAAPCANGLLWVLCVGGQRVQARWWGCWENKQMGGACGEVFVESVCGACGVLMGVLVVLGPHRRGFEPSYPPWGHLTVSLMNWSAAATSSCVCCPSHRPYAHPADTA
jgi:hypothetical protein